VTDAGQSRTAGGPKAAAGRTPRAANRLFDPNRDEARRLAEQVKALEVRLAEAEETIEAIRGGGVDAVLVTGANGRPRVFTLESGCTATSALPTCWACRAGA
jgi:L-serine deaminase